MCARCAVRNIVFLTDASTRRRRRSNRYVTMNQREEWRSLYCVVCPRCESVSPADDLSCPYCGADRHGAVLTRTRASLFEFDEAARAMVRAASSQVGEMRRNQTNDATPSGSADQSAALLSLPSSFALKPGSIVLLVVGVCLLIALYAWVRISHRPAAHEAHENRVSAAGTVHKLAAVAPAAPSDRHDATGRSAPAEAVSLAQENFVAMAGTSGRATFGLPASADIASCGITAGPAWLASVPVCDSLAATQASHISEAPHSIASSVTMTSPANTKAATPTHGRVEHTSASARHASTRPRAHAHERTTHAQHALRSAGHAKKVDKTHPRVRNAQRASTAARGESDAFDAPGVGALAPAGDPAMTSTGSWKPGSVPDSHDTLRSRLRALLPAGTAATNKGRGDAH